MMAKRTETSALSPLYALWSLGSILGLPTLLFAIGFLAYRGHVNLLNIPTVLLEAEIDHLVFTGCLWIVWTLKVVVWHWSFVVITAAAAGAAWFWRKCEVRRRRQCRPSSTALLLALIALASLMLVAEFNLLSYTSTAFAKAAGQSATPDEDPLKYFFEDQGGEGQRELIYRALSWCGLLIGGGLLWALKIPASEDGEGGTRRDGRHIIIFNALHLTLVLTCSLALLSWPMSFGRLMLPYERPVVKLPAAAGGMGVYGIVLNPKGEQWVVLERGADPSKPTYSYHNVEVKDLKNLQIICYTHLFSFSGNPSDDCR